MKNNKLGQEPAFANVAFDKEGTFTHCESDGHYGMSKRFYAACAAMQGILSNQVEKYSVNIDEISQSYKKRLVSQAYQFADELLKQEYNEE